MQDGKNIEIDWTALEIPLKRAEVAIKSVMKRTGVQMKVSSKVYSTEDEEGNKERGIFPSSVERPALVFAHLISFVSEKRKRQKETLMLYDAELASQIIQIISPYLSTQTYKEVFKRVTEKPDQNYVQISKALARRYLSVCPIYSTTGRIRSDAQDFMSRVIEEMMLYNVERAIRSAKEYGRKELIPKDFENVYEPVSKEQILEIIQVGLDFAKEDD